MHRVVAAPEPDQSEALAATNLCRPQVVAMRRGIA